MGALKEPVEYIRLDADVKIGENLKMQFYLTRTEQKAGALLFILRHLVKEGERTVVFAATKHHVEYLASLLAQCGMEASPIYGQMDQTARNISLAKFKNKTTKVLVVTDVAARGIDIPELENVINFDFPGKAKLYVHRVGRTARAGRNGRAYSLVAVDEVPYMLDLYLFLGRKPMNVAQEDEDPETNTEAYYGTIPERVLELECETVRGITNEDSDIAALSKTVTNALKLYKKTRSQASKLSAARAKPVRQAARVHPALAKLISTTEADQDAFVAHLRSFRPDTTVLESNEGSRGHAAMALKRGFHDRTIKEVKDIRRKKIAKMTEDADVACQEVVPGELLMADGTTADFEDDEKPGAFRDPKFFIDYLPTGEDPKGDEGYALGGEERVDDMVLDLMGEDAASMNKQRSVMKWDAKKKKYTVQKIGKDGKVIKENEAGKKVKESEAKKVGRSYKAWQEKTKMKIARVGEEEKLGGSQVKYKKIGGRRISMHVDSAGDSELKTKDEMVKAKQAQESNKNKNSKGHKGGKGASPLDTMKVKGRAKFSKGNHALKAAGIQKKKGTASAPGHGRYTLSFLIYDRSHCLPRPSRHSRAQHSQSFPCPLIGTTK
jgi:ATP-dependent RNA helicase DDX54/DBP10